MFGYEFMKNILVALVFIVLAAIIYRYAISYSDNAVATSDSRAGSQTKVMPTSNDPVYSDGFSDSDTIAPTYVDLGSDKPPTLTSIPQNMTTTSFSCDGRQHCSQMTSCAEATYFSNNCPNTKMDGNNDGIPCEQQWCN